MAIRKSLNYNHPLIGISPMAGYTDSPFRRLLRDFSPEVLLWTELISVDALYYGNKNCDPLLRFKPVEQPLNIQLFGNKPEFFVAAVPRIEELGFAGIDINMGCPARKVVKSEYGSALILRPDIAYKIVAGLKQATKLPISVKTRIGWADDSELLTFCRGLAEAGADLITIHGRTVKQAHSGEAQWDPIYRVQEHLPIPVLGNGGVISLADGRDKQKNLAGFTIGRAIIGNPWLLSETKPTRAERLDLIRKQAQNMVEHYGEKTALPAFRKHVVEYLKGFPGAKKLRQSLLEIKTLADLTTTLGKYADNIIEGDDHDQEQKQQ